MDASNLEYRSSHRAHSPCRRLRRQWQAACRAYRAAGEPFGPTLRGLELWIEFRRIAAIN